MILRLVCCVRWLFDEGFCTTEVNGVENVTGKVLLLHVIKAYGGVEV